MCACSEFVSQMRKHQFRKPHSFKVVSSKPAQLLSYKKASIYYLVWQTNLPSSTEGNPISNGHSPYKYP